MKVVLTGLYIILVCEKFYLFYLFDYPWIKKVVLYDCTFDYDTKVKVKITIDNYN